MFRYRTDQCRKSSVIQVRRLAVYSSDVDSRLGNYLGEVGSEQRVAVNIQSDRCGVFAS